MQTFETTSFSFHLHYYLKPPKALLADSGGMPVLNFTLTHPRPFPTSKEGCYRLQGVHFFALYTCCWPLTGILPNTLKGYNIHSPGFQPGDQIQTNFLALHPVQMGIWIPILQRNICRLQLFYISSFFPVRTGKQKIKASGASRQCSVHFAKKL